jgi:hypothetical protein
MGTDKSRLFKIGRLRLRRTDIFWNRLRFGGHAVRSACRRSAAAAAATWIRRFRKLSDSSHGVRRDHDYDYDYDYDGDPA